MAKKFNIGDKVFVSVSKEKTWMSHFNTGFVGIVERRSSGDYAVAVLNKKQTKVVNMIAWYEADDLKKLPQTLKEKDHMLSLLSDYQDRGY